MVKYSLVLYYEDLKAKYVKKDICRWLMHAVFNLTETKNSNRLFSFWIRNIFLKENKYVLNIIEKRLLFFDTKNNDLT